ncbi:MAG: DinB family protein, partial [Pseudomonadota bacterium]
MIGPDYPRLMARYSRWQNESLLDAASALPDDERRKDRGAFFCSIAETFAHLLWADRLWLSRFGGCAAPAQAGISESTALLEWDEYARQRRMTDREMLDWSAQLPEEDLRGDLTWYSGALDREVTRPRA